MQKLKVAAIGLFLLFVAVVVYLFAGGTLSVAGRVRIDRAAILAEASHYHATILRDVWGIPHVEGPRDADVAFGLAYAESEDDFKTIQDVALAVRGQLAASEGLKAAPGDYLVHLMRVWPTVNAHYAALPADLRAVLEAYAAGVNLYAAKHPGEVKPGLLPMTGKDVAAGFVFKTPLFYGLDSTLKRLTEKTGGKPPPEIGSNGAAVSPLRTSDGATRLLVNSHQPYTGPVAWYEAVLQSGQGWHVAGGFFPGSPFMLHGFNAHLGWANTVNDPDLVDLYRLRLNPSNRQQYWLDGRWHNLIVKDVALHVRIFGPFILTVHRPLAFAAQGPVINTDHGSYAIRYAGMGEWRQPLQYYRLDKAQDLAQWKAAMALCALPSINYVYADAKGNIGYVYNAQFPIRKAGVNWKTYLDGTRSDLIWHHYLPFSAVPQVWNPKSGFVFNSNNTPFIATAPGDDLKPQDFPAWMGIQTNMTNRAMRALHNFMADPAISDAGFKRIKYDLAYAPQSEMMQNVRKLVALPAQGDKDIVAAQAILAHWNGMTDRANRDAALAVLTVEPVVRAEETHAAPIALTDSLKRAIAVLKRHYGRLDPPWGAVNRIVRGKINLPIDGGPDIYRAVYGELQSDGRFHGVAGDTLIMFVTWDRSGQVSAQSISPFGAAMTRPDSPHYADQTPLFAEMKLKPVWFTDAELKGHIEARYAPGAPH